MIINNNKKFSLLAGCMLLPASAMAVDVGVGLKASTLGWGVDLSVPVSQTLSARLSLSSADSTISDESYEVGNDGTTKADLNADLTLDFASSALLLDWHAFENNFHFTFGLLKNNGTIDLNGNIDGEITLGSGASATTYSDTDIAGVNGSISVADSYEPYLGIGWRSKESNNSGLSFAVELGVVLMDPKVSLSADLTDTAASQSEIDDLNNDIRTAEDDINDELSDFEIYPVLSVGLNYAF